MSSNCSYFLALIACSILLSCQPGNKPESIEQAASKPVNFRTQKRPIPFSGHWISAEYLTDIQANQSPRSAQEESGDCFISIPATTLTPTTMVYNFHEGISDLVPVYINERFELWENLNDSLTRMLYPLQLVTQDTLSVGDKKFVRLPASLRDGQPAILEEILFKGKYKDASDALVEFKANGEMSGIGKYKYYLPVIDYFDAGLQIDQVAMGEKPGEWEYFGFKFKKEKLDIYQLKCKTYDQQEKRCVDVTFGPKLRSLQKSF